MLSSFSLIHEEFLPHVQNIRNQKEITGVSMGNKDSEHLAWAWLSPGALGAGWEDSGFQSGPHIGITWGTRRKSLMPAHPQGMSFHWAGTWPGLWRF